MPTPSPHRPETPSAPYDVGIESRPAAKNGARTPAAVLTAGLYIRLPEPAYAELLEQATATGSTPSGWARTRLLRALRQTGASPRRRPAKGLPSEAVRVLVGAQMALATAGRALLDALEQDRAVVPDPVNRDDRTHRLEQDVDSLRRASAELVALIELCR